MLDSSRRKELRTRVDSLREDLGLRTIELTYVPSVDILYSDLNQTITKNDLKEDFFDYLGLTDESKEITDREDISTVQKIEACARLLEGKTERDIVKASRYCVDNAGLIDEVMDLIKDLEGSNIVIFSGMPKQVVDYFINKNIVDIYKGDQFGIYGYGTVLERNVVTHNGSPTPIGTLSGNVEKVYGDEVRARMIRESKRTV